MKKITLITTGALALMGYLIISGYSGGAALSGTYDCTGAETGLGNPAGCSTGGGCHASTANTNILVTLELDSAGIPVTNYVGGMSYKVKITGTNNTTSNLPRFGFQIGSIKGSTAQVTPTNAGTWPSPYPTNVHYAAPQASLYVVGVVEHGKQLPPTTGTGGNGTTYVETVNWTAPAKGTGTVSIWGALNAVNNNGTNDNGDLWNIKHIVLNEEIITGVNNVSAEPNSIKVYPNPFSLQATFSLGSEVENAAFSLYDITGREVKQFNFSGKEVTLDRGGLTNGIYFYRIVSGENISTGKVIIQ